MWQKHREKENIEGQSRHPFLDPVIQREKEGSNQPLASTQESEAENTKAGCPDQEGFITEMHKKKKTKGGGIAPKIRNKML